MLAVQLSAHLSLVAVDGFVDFGLVVCDLYRPSLQIAIVARRLYVVTQNAAAAVQPLNFQKHIDLTKLVSWQHVAFEIPSRIITTKFLHPVRRTTETWCP